jgi:zinc finger SWIM domain-containing protein 3
VGETIVDGEPFLERRRAGVGTNCKAFFKVSDSYMTGKWHVCKVNLVHNHDLSPESSFLIPAFRYIPIRYQNMLEYNEDQGMAPGDNIEIVFKIAGGYSKGTFTRKDARNHLDKYRRSKLRAIGGDDAVTLTESFEKNKLSDPNLFFSYKLTDEGRLWNIFWADGRGRAAYKYFHDVVVMDATYLTNR